MNQTAEESRSNLSTARDVARRIFKNENAALVIVLVVLIGIMGAATKGLSLRAVNVSNILLQSSIRGVASIGQTFVILSAGIDISIGGVGLVCSVLGASLMTESPVLSIVSNPSPIYIAIPLVLLCGAAFGVVNGTLVSRARIPPLIVTLGMWEISKGIGFEVSGGRSIAQQPDALAFWGSGNIGGVPVPVIIFVVVAVIAYFVLNHTIFGRSTYATGGNPISAWLSGISVKNVQFAVYTISGFLAGLAGVIITSRVMSASMRTLQGLEIDSIAAVTVGGVSLAGGRGGIIGAIIGVIIIGVINNAMSILGAEPSVQGIVKGMIIIGAVAADYARRR